MKALISPIEPRETGYRVAEVHDEGFEVAEPLFWVDCGSDVLAHQVWYDPSDQQFKPFPEPEVPSQPTVNGGVETL